jgi:hypothetical protein
MGTVMDPLGFELEDGWVVATAAKYGFRLVQCETDTGQLVWEWRRGSEPPPRFAARRLATQWMTEHLAREHGIALASDAGLS